MRKVRFIFQFLFLLTSLAGQSLFGQTNTPIKLRWDNNGSSIKGDFVQIGNHRNGGSESTSTLKIPVTSSCLKVKWAGLYWVSTLGIADRNNPNINKVQFKLPGDVYQELTADSRDETIFAGHEYLYNCYKDVTSLVQNLGTNFNNAEYAIRNIYGGSWGGWSLVVVYEDITAASAKRVYIYDGCDLNFYNYQTSLQYKNINITGFQTPPTGSTFTARMGIFVGAGNRGFGSHAYDELRINGHQQGGNTYPNHKNDFMDGSFTINNSESAFIRNPATFNHLDLDIFDVPNATQVIGNNATSLQIQFASLDAYITYVVPFSVQVIEPEIEIEKKAFVGTTDVTGGSANLGDILRYEISFKNTGTDDAKNLTIADALPKNLDLTNMLATLNMPVGVTHTFNPATRELVFTIPDGLVKKGSATHKITFEVRVPASCDELVDACSNKIANIVQAKYWGHINSPVNPFSATSTSAFRTCSGVLEGPSTFIANLGTCTSKSTKVLCRPTLELVAGAGFDTYSWTKVGQTGVLATTQKLTVNSAGVYKVFKTKAGCANMTEEITVVPYTTTNVIKPFADEVLKCTNDGSDYPQIYLCGTTATKQINLNITGATYKWEKLNNCPSIPSNYQNTHCPVYNQFGCSWSQVSTSASFTVSQAGDYRVSVDSGGCVEIHYFKVSKTNLSPSVDNRDVICTQNGRIKINNVPTGYEYELRKNDRTTIVKNKQASNEFSITPAEFDTHATGGSYVVFIYGASTHTQTKNCVFEVPTSIRKRNPQINVTSTPLACTNSKGTIRVQLSDMYPPYTYVVRQGSQTGAIVAQRNAVNDSDITFTGINDGNYHVQVTTPDGCNFSKPVSVAKLPELKATATVKRHLMMGDGGCNNKGIIRVDVTGGTKDPIYGYSYRINGQTTTWQDYGTGYYEFEIENGLVPYNIEVIDKNNCSVQVISPPARYLVLPQVKIEQKYTDCGAKQKVTFVVMHNPDNMTLKYRIKNLDTGQITEQVGEVFPGLPVGGRFEATVTYSLGTQSCGYTSQLPVLSAADKHSTEF